jgi:hypothetical protein
MKKILLLMALILCTEISLVSAAHFIIGQVNDAVDGKTADGTTVVLWRGAGEILDNITDIVGPSGNSGVSSYYMIDCELLNISCAIDDEIKIQVINNGNNYNSGIVNLSVTGAGFDTAPNLTLNSPPNISFIIVDDDITSPIREIDLLPATTKTITCEGILSDADGENDIRNATAVFYDANLSTYTGSDDNNEHYTNNSCYLDTNYGNENQSYANCSFSVWYYANTNTWNCTLKATDNLSSQYTKTNRTFINSLLAIDLDSPLNFGTINVTNVSDEKVANVTNYGNVRINLSLSGYARTAGDNLSMNCTSGTIKNISIGYEKYNLTDPTPGVLNLQMFESYYTNLTSSPTRKEFNLNYRQSDIANDASKLSYWRIYIPDGGIAGSCSGKIIFGASVGTET